MRGLGVVALALAGFAPALRAQDPTMQRAFELERRGNYAAAADAYRSVLATRPGDPAPLLGLERVLLPMGRSAEIVGQNTTTSTQAIARLAIPTRRSRWPPVSGRRMPSIITPS